MPSAYEGTDIISYFHEVEIYHTATPYIISRKQYIMDKHTKYDIISVKDGEWMKDKRIDKVKQHFDIFFNNQKFKVISCKIDGTGSILSIKTKIFGQAFPHNGRFTITIPSQNTIQDFSITFRSMGKNSSVEHWEYTVKTE